MNFFPASGPKAHILTVLQAAMIAGGGVRILLFALFHSRSTDKNLRGTGHQKGVYKGKACGREAFTTSGREVLVRSAWLRPEGVHTLLETLLTRREPEGRLASGARKLRFPAPPNPLCSFPLKPQRRTGHLSHF